MQAATIREEIQLQSRSTTLIIFALCAIAFVLATARFGVTASHASATMVFAQSDTGAKLYLTNCQPCHQANGQGQAELFYPPLAGSEWVTGNETKMLRVIISGLTGEIEVQGEMFKGAMPGWGPLLDDNQIAAVASYVRNSWGNKAPAVTAVTVAKIRKESASRTTPWTEAELRRMGG